MTDLSFRLVISVLVFVAVGLAVRFSAGPLRWLLRRQELAFDRVLRQQLMIGVEPLMALGLTIGGVALAGVLGLLLTGSLILGLVFAGLALLAPLLIVHHLEQKRLRRLELQLIDGLTTLASGVRAGLNLVQSMELLVQNHTGPMGQEIAHLLREYQMGIDLNQALRNASNRIGSPLYRLTFTAITTHLRLGGDTGESLDRIAESVRQIQQLDGRLEALTAQARAQATMMAAMPPVFLAILWTIDPEGVAMLFTEPVGRLILLGVGLLMATAFVWIRKIMAVDV